MARTALIEGCTQHDARTCYLNYVDPADVASECRCTSCYDDKLVCQADFILAFNKPI